MTAAAFYLDALVALAVLGACAAAGALVVERALPWLAGAPRVLAHGLAITAAIQIAHLLPGAIGILSRWTVAAAAAVLLAAALRVRGGGATRETPAHPSSGMLTGAVAIVAGLAVAATVLGFLRVVAGTTLTGIDGTIYQVPTVIRWMDENSLWGIHQFVSDYSNGTYPMHGNLLQLAVVLPFERAFLTNAVAFPYFVLACVAVYALARELSATRAAALLGAATFGAVPVLSSVSTGTAQTDLPAVAALGTALVFGVRHLRTPRRAELVLAATALGLAFGTKWYGLPFAALLGALGVVALLVRRRGAARVAREAALVAGVALLAGGFWMLRDWVQTGNPLFPVAVELGGVTIFDAPRDVVRERGGFTLLDYATDAGVWRDYLWPTFRHDFAEPAGLIVAGAVLAALLALWRRREWPVLAVVAAAAGLALLYAATPYSAFGAEGMPVLASASTRYGLPALLAAAAAAAWALSRAGPLRVPAALAALAATVLGLADHYTLSTGQTAAGLLIALAIAAVLWVARRADWRGTRARVVVVAGLALIGAGAGEKLRERMEDTSYASFDPVYAAIEGMRAQRVAIAGTITLSAVAPALPAYTPTFRNEVERLGYLDRHLLRSHRDAAGFQAALRRGGHDALIVGRGNPPRPRAPEEDWAQQIGWRPVVSSPHLALLLAPKP